MATNEPKLSRRVLNMASGSFVSYLRVSTERQGRSGLGLEAQRKAVADFLNRGQWSLKGEFVEVESGKNNERPKLAEALRTCRLHNATLVIAKIARLSRNVDFLKGLQEAGVRFVATDMPEANEMVVQIMAAVAQAERKMISERTKDALAAAKAKGKKLGGDRGNFALVAVMGRAKSREVRQNRAATRNADLRPIIDDIRSGGAGSLRGIAAGLNERGIPTARGATWTGVQVKRVLDATAGATV